MPASSTSKSNAAHERTAAAGRRRPRRRAPQDREEYKSLWRDTQRQLNELTTNVNRNTLAIADTNELIHKLAERLDKHAADSREADARLGTRIETLVSAIAAKL